MQKNTNLGDIAWRYARVFHVFKEFHFEVKIVNIVFSFKIL